MNWAEIKRHYVSACYQAPAASGEALFHLSEGQRTIAARLDLEATETIEDEQATVTDQDWLALPEDLYNVIHVFDVTTGNDLEPEEGGMRGRARYLEAGTGKPPTGIPRWYAISGGKMYFRPTPEDDSFVIHIRGKATTPDLTDADYGSEPTIPKQYHMAIAWAAALSFLGTHPKVAKEVGGESLQAMRVQLEERLRIQKLPKDEERKDHRGRVTVGGFRMRTWG